MQICKNCNQVMPQTDEERREEKRIALKEAATKRMQIRKAGRIWREYNKAHPTPSSWVNYLGIGQVLVVVFSIITFFSTLMFLDGNMQEGRNWIAFLAYFAVAGLGAYFLWRSLWSRVDKFEIAVTRAFTLRHKAEAEILGFEMHRK